ncbi:MAG: S9 family peptidase [Bryobacterales bacterium]|nr:S9 family peptidase [Bryobacterales bacterium]
MNACRLLRVVLGVVPIALLSGQSVVMPTDLHRIRSITGLEVTADGRKAVFLVRSIEKEEYRNRIYSVGLAPGAVPVELTRGDRNDASPSISPDGEWMAFLRRDPAPKGRMQAWVMPLAMPGEPRMVTELEYGVAELKWRPDSKALLVSSNLPLSKIEGKPPFPAERAGRDWKDVPEGTKANADGTLAELRAWLEANAAKDNPFVIHRLSFQDEESLRREMTIANLYTVELESGTVKALGHGFEPRLQFTYSPDGKKIAYSSLPDFSVHPDRFGSIPSQRSAVFEMAADGSGRRAVWTGNVNASRPRYSADGRFLYVLSRNLERAYGSQTQLVRIPLRGGEAAVGKWPSSVGGFVPLADGSALIGGPWQGGFPVLREQFDGSAPKAVIEAPAGVQAFEGGGGRLVYALTSPENPSELYVREANGQTRRLTELNTGWLKGKTLAKQEEHWITRPDGTRVQMWIMRPVGFRAGVKSPWVLDMHGGPAAMWGPGEASMWHEFQLFCARGYGVVYANPRGSGGYGEEFQRANFRDWGTGPAGDVLAALDEARKLIPEIDGERLFLTGGSYAGYLTAWIVGHDQRFRAAAAQRGVYDLRTFYGEGNAYRLAPEAMGGLFWEAEARAVYERESPISYVEKIRTPLLILHGSADLRTGVTQSEMLFRALKALGREVEYVRYPGVGHELTRSGPPVPRLDHAMRIVEFFERWR